MQVATSLKPIAVRFTPNPLDESTDELFEVPCLGLSATVQEYLDLLGVDTNNETLIVRVSGCELHPPLYRVTIVAPGDELVIVIDAAAIGLAVASIALTLAGSISYAAGAGALISLVLTGAGVLASIGSSLLAAAEAPGLPQELPDYTYGAGQINTNFAAIGSPIPIIYGDHVVGGNVIQATTGHVNGTAGARGSFNATIGGQTTNVLVALCEGPVAEIGTIGSDKDFLYFNRFGTNVGPLYDQIRQTPTDQIQLTGFSASKQGDVAAFSFFINERSIVDQVEVMVRKRGNPTGNIRFDIFSAGEFNAPLGASQGQALAPLAPLVPDLWTPLRVTFERSPDLAAGTWNMAFTADYTPSVTDYIEVGIFAAPSQPFYSHVWYAISGGAWSNVANHHGVMAVRATQQSTDFTGIKVNGNEVSNFAATGYVGIRLGNEAQRALPGTADVRLETNLDLSIPWDTPVTAQTTDGVDGFGLVIEFARGYYRQSREGKTRALPFTMQVRWRVLGDTVWVGDEIINEPVLFFLTPDVITYRIDFSQGGNFPDLIGKRIEIEVTNIWIHGRGYNGPTEINWRALQEYGDDTQTARHPHLALLQLDFAAGGATGRLESITTRVRGKKLWYQANVGGRWQWEFGYTENPAWCCLDIILNPRYGGGARLTLDNVDLESFRLWSLYCQQLIFDGDGMIDRARLDLVVDQSRPWFEWARQIASVGRAKLIIIGNVIKAKIDEPAPLTQVFTPGNIVANSFQVDYRGVEKRINRVIVEYLDEDLDYNKNTITQDDPDARAANLPVISETVSMFGITNQHRAARAAKYLLNNQKYVTYGVRFETFIDGVRAEPGDVIGVSSDVPAWEQTAGLMLDAPGVNAVAIDRAFSIPGGDTDPYRITYWTVNSATGLEEVVSRTILENPGSSFQPGVAIDIDPAVPADLQADKGDPYSIMPIRNLTDPTLPTQEPGVMLCKITERTLTEDFTVAIEAVEYNELIYQDDPGILTEAPQQGQDDATIPAAPRNLQLTATRQPGTQAYSVLATWQPAAYPGGPYAFAVFARQEKINVSRYTEIVRTVTNSWQFIDIAEGTTWTIAICPISPVTGVHYNPESPDVARATVKLRRAPYNWPKAKSMKVF